MSKKLFVNINELRKLTGLSEWFIRQNIDEIPHIKTGKKYLFNVEQVENYLLNKAKDGEK